jgi:deglycase
VNRQTGKMPAGKLSVMRRWHNPHRRGNLPAAGNGIATGHCDRSGSKNRISEVTTMELSGARVAIVATNGFEQSELEVPLDRLKTAGAAVDVSAPEPGQIRGWSHKDWGRSVAVDRTLDGANAADYDALVLPGGQINPNLLRTDRRVLDLIRAMHERKKIVAAVCHAPWLLIESGLAKGLKATSYKSIKTDMVNAGAKWEDSEVVAHRGIVTSRNPDDLEAFSQKIIEALVERRGGKRSAA